MFKFVWIIVVSLIVGSNCVSAKEKELEWLTYYPTLGDIGEIEKGPVIEIEGKKNNTYYQFVDMAAALDDLRQSTSIIEEIMSAYDLETLSKENWKDYREKTYCYVENSTIYNYEYEDIKLILDCFDVCENNEINNEILEIYNEKNSDVTDLLIRLPYTAPSYIEYQNNKKEVTSKASAFNVSAGVSYASTYAANSNGNYRYFSNNDCTNFASQIARAGGINDTSVWYYNNESSYGTTWTVADQFVKYWGVVHGDEVFRSFSRDVSKGDFIAVDSNNDGKYNHVGFVTDVRNYESELGYADFKVAQHSRNYHAWVSSSTNTWETVSGVKVIVRTPHN